MIFNRRETPVATVNLISLIKFSENEHLKWGQIEQRKWMENSIHLQTGITYCTWALPGGLPDLTVYIISLVHYVHLGQVI